MQCNAMLYEKSKHSSILLLVMQNEASVNSKINGKSKIYFYWINIFNKVRVDLLLASARRLLHSFTQPCYQRMSLHLMKFLGILGPAAILRRT